MYGTRSGAYLLVGSGWSGSKPKGINGRVPMLHSPGDGDPRVFKDSTPEDLEAVQSVINQIAGYPLSKFDGTLKTVDWRKAPSFPGDAGKEEVKWVKPELFLDQLSKVLDQVPPLPGEEAIYPTRSVFAEATASLNASFSRSSFPAAVRTARYWDRSSNSVIMDCLSQVIGPRRTTVQNSDKRATTEGWSAIT